MTKDTLLIFDLDGTLWDSSVPVADSWNLVLKKHLPGWKDITADYIRSVMGTTLAEIAESCMPDFDPEERAKIFGECESFEVDYIREHGGTLFPGVRETLEELTEAGYPLAIVSNCQTGYIDAFLVSMDTRQYFCDYEEWGSAKRTKAENIRLVMERNGFDKAIYIGDIERDMIAAHNADIPFIHAAYGFGTIDSPEMVIHAFPELLKLFPA